MNAAGKATDSTPARLHVVQVIPRDVARRLGRSLRDLAPALEVEDVRLTVVSDDAALVDALGDSPARAQRVVVRSGWLGGWRARQLARLELDTPAVVHIWGVAALEAARQWAAATGRPLLVHLTGWEDLTAYDRLGPQPDEPLAVLSRALAESVHGAGPQPPAVIAPAVRPPQSAVEPAGRDRMAGIACVGPVGPASKLLIQALSRLRENQLGFHAVVLTGAAADRGLWRQVRDAGLAHHVSVLDRDRMVEPAVLGADILIVPRVERQLSSWPLVAMARGALVLAPRQQAAEWFIEDETFAGFDLADASELTLLLTRALSGQKDLRRIAGQAARYVAARHDPAAIAAALAGVYGGLAGVRGAAGSEPRKP